MSVKEEHHSISNSLTSKISRALDEPNPTFAKLIEILELNPKTDFKNIDLRGVRFGKLDVSGYDFSGTNLERADFGETTGIEKAIFDRETKIAGIIWPKEEAKVYRNKKLLGVLGRYVRSILAPAKSSSIPRDPAPFRQPAPVEARAVTPSNEIVHKLIAMLDARGEIQRAQTGGLVRQTIVDLARRLRPDETLDFDQAVAELENAVTIALDVIAKGKRGSNQSDFVNNVLARVAEQTKEGRFDQAAKEVDAALAELDRREAEQRETMSQSRTTLLQAGIEQDILRRDASSLARRVEQSVAIQHPDDAAARFESLRERHDEFFVNGHDKGINFSLEVAIEIARRTIHVARNSDQRGAALSDLGSALWRLGERESGTTRLDEAVATYREALKERSRERMPLDWAATQSNLGSALRALGERESGTARLDEAIAAYREALKEQTRDRVPLDWAMTQNNLGGALHRLGERESDTARLDEAVAVYREALKEQTRDRVPLDWAMTQSNLGAALRALGDREGATARLDEAVAAYREALKERTRKDVPLDWAATQNNLGNALLTLGERESGTARLDEAVVAYREALKEHTRERAPLQWAMTQNNLGIALRALGERENGTARLDEAVAAYREALQVFTAANASYFVDQTNQNLARAQSLLAERRADG